MSNDGEIINVAHNLVGHESQDAHLCSTAVVDLDGSLLLLGGLVKLVPAKVEGAIAEITGELGRASEVAAIAREASIGHLHHSPSSNHLGPNHARDSGKGGKSSGNVLGTRESNASLGEWQRIVNVENS